MRIIAGRHKGHRISTKCRTRFRPTTDRIREWIFQVIMPHLPESSFLDLFAGSGSFGLEALSRGCAEAVFVDKNTGQLIRGNIARIAPESTTKVVNNDVVRFLRAQTRIGKFSIIAADPPYAYGSFEKFLAVLYDSDILAQGGLFILETGKHSDVTFPDPFWAPVRNKEFGETIIEIFLRE